MQTIINIHEAKTHLSRLMEQASAGEEIIIAKARKSMARLAPVVKPEELDLLQGKAGIAKNFDTPLPTDFLTFRRRD